MIFWTSQRSEISNFVPMKGVEVFFLLSILRLSWLFVVGRNRIETLLPIPLPKRIVYTAQEWLRSTDVEADGQADGCEYARQEIGRCLDLG